MYLRAPPWLAGEGAEGEGGRRDPGAGRRQPWAAPPAPASCPTALPGRAGAVDPKSARCHGWGRWEDEPHATPASRPVLQVLRGGGAR